jgi:hypothetical protein
LTYLLLVTEYIKEMAHLKVKNVDFLILHAHCFSMLVCRPEVADKCLQLIQIEICKENNPLISFIVGHVVRKGNPAKRKRIHLIENGRINTAQFHLGLEAYRKTARHFKDCAKHVVLPRMTQNTQYPVTSYLPLSQSVTSWNRKPSGGHSQNFNYMA